MDNYYVAAMELGLYVFDTEQEGGLRENADLQSLSIMMQLKILMLTGMEHI